MSPHHPVVDGVLLRQTNVLPCQLYGVWSWTSSLAWALKEGWIPEQAFCRHHTVTARLGQALRHILHGLDAAVGKDWDPTIGPFLDGISDSSNRVPV